MDDFEAFKKKKQAEKEAAQKASQEEAAFDEAAKKMGWIDGIGYTGATNPKVKGFIVGRARRKKIDPNALERPKGIESHRHDAPDAKPAEKKPTPPAPKPKGFNRY